MRSSGGFPCFFIRETVDDMDGLIFVLGRDITRVRQPSRRR